jgi:DNA adenine methylase
MKITFKTPITYYGGKQKMLPLILPRIPIHKSYNEIFAGGAAVFFAKPPSEVEVLNDINSELINFYRVAQTNFSALEKEIKLTLHSRDLHRQAWIVYSNPDMFSEVKRAWALWVMSSQSFCAKLEGPWGYDLADSGSPQRVQTKKEGFTKALLKRLEKVQIECTDALYIIDARDRKDAFFYVDPPYYNSDCGHYDGYSLQDYENLLKALSKIKGKFLLSSYPSEIVQEYAKRYKWNMFSVEKNTSVNTKSGYLKRKIEVLTANYPI